MKISFKYCTILALVGALTIQGKQNQQQNLVQQRAFLQDNTIAFAINVADLFDSSCEEQNVSDQLDMDLNFENILVLPDACCGCEESCGCPKPVYHPPTPPPVPTPVQPSYVPVPPVTYHEIPASLDPQRTTTSFTDVSGAHQFQTTALNLPVTNSYTTTSYYDGVPTVKTITTSTDEIPVPVVQTWTTTSSGVPTVHSQTSTIEKIPTEHLHTHTTTYDGVVSEKTYTTTSYVYPSAKMAYTSTTVADYEKTTHDKDGVPTITSSSKTKVEKPNDKIHTYTTFVNGPPGTVHSYTTSSSDVPIEQKHVTETYVSGQLEKDEYTTTITEQPVTQKETSTVTIDGKKAVHTFTGTSYIIPDKHSVTTTTTDDGIPTYHEKTVTTYDIPETNTHTHTVTVDGVPAVQTYTTTEVIIPKVTTVTTPGGGTYTTSTNDVPVTSQHTRTDYNSKGVPTVVAYSTTHDVPQSQYVPSAVAVPVFETLTKTNTVDGVQNFYTYTETKYEPASVPSSAN